ncbi:hypothetical protein F4680DRAFT_115030 [Xylaria scruposa]|nr:hypothetical protein F4680DRAFT_115030 [Xylaria scruposa]
MATTPSLVAAQPAVGLALQDAINDFRNVLDEEQRRELAQLKPVPDADHILVFTAQLDAIDRNRRGRSFSSRLHTILLSVRNFCSIVDTFVSSHPEIGALVWGSIKLTMLVISNYASYYEATSDLFMRVGRLCPLFNEYLILYRSSTRLRESLLHFHTSIVNCCKHVVEAVRRPWPKQAMKALWNPFEQEFKPDIDDIHKYSNQVKEEIALAQAQADSQEQQLQALERKEASGIRSTARKFFSHTYYKLDQMRELQMQNNERRKQKRKQQLISALSKYDYLRSLKQNRLKRYKYTSDWIFQTPEFHRWIDGVVPLLCCFGKMGSGKTITTARVIDYILSEKGSDCVVSFFFVESGNLESLGAGAIIRCLLRQRIDPAQIPQEVNDRLEQIDSFSDLDELIELLRVMMPPPKVSYIVIDGLDECEKSDRSRLLEALSSLNASEHEQNIRLFLSGRNSLQMEIQKQFAAFDSVSMDCPLARDGISIFIRDIIREKIQNGELSIGDPFLEEDIKSALCHGAQGMFIWVVFQVYEICAQHCDEDIHNTLRNLPKSLTEVYCRALQRIKSRGHEKEAQKIFPWIAASKQLLSLSQLREAIAIEIGQQYAKPERLYNDMRNITLWCENLVEVDEEYQLVQFAHSTVGKFLIEEPIDPTLAKFRVNLEQVDHDIGEKCITYLVFNDFKTTVAQRPKPIIVPNPTQIAQSALGYRSKPVSMLTKLLPMSNSKPVDLSTLRNLTGEYSSTKYEKLVPGYPFLEYASANWILHTRNFKEETSKTWRLWKNMVYYGNDLVNPPWKENASNNNSHILMWAYDARHCGLIRLIASSVGFSMGQRMRIIFNSVKDNNLDALNVLLEGQYLGSENSGPLVVAARGGYLEIVEKLLAAKADVNAVSAENDWTALQVAAGRGHIDIVECLLTAQADVNAAAAYSNGRTALQAAAEKGHLKIVKRLLAIKADVNAAPAIDGGLTALQAAAKGGHLEIVERLLAAKADVNAAAANHNGRSALQAAAEKGHLNIVKLLLAAKADVNAAAAEYEGLTALQAATRQGHIEIKMRLERAGAYE